MSDEDEIEVEVNNEDEEHYVEYDLQIYPSDYTLRAVPVHRESLKGIPIAVLF
jgi:hypothetical protein